MIVIPAIDLRKGQCVRLRQGSATEEKIYDHDPVELAQQFASAGAQIIHVVDLDAALAEQASQNRILVEQICRKTGLPIQFGGGLRTVADVEELLDKGVTRVVLGTLATQSPETVETLVDSYGERIAVGIDARGGRVMAGGWQHETAWTALKFACDVAALGVSRIVFTDITRDGMLSGLNIEQTLEVARASGVRVTASGGISSLEDIAQLRHSGEPLVDSVIVGKALYERRFTLEQAIEAASNGKVSIS